MYVPQCETFMEKCNVGEGISAAGDRPALTAATIFCRTESGSNKKWSFILIFLFIPFLLLL